MSYSVSSPSDRRRSPALDSVANLIKEQHSDLLISKQKLERAKGIELVRIKREQRTQDLCFSSRRFVLCGLPVRRLPNDRLLYERRNGRFVLQITGHPEFGVPFGQDRLVPIFLATLAVQQKSQTIRFRTAAEMLESFGMHTGGKVWLSYRCFKAKRVEAIPLFGQFGLANQIGTVEYSRPRRFRGMLEQWLGTIRVIWPECPARISSDGQSIRIAQATSIVPAEARYA